MATLLYRIGRSAFRHRRAVLAAWLTVLAAIAACVFAFGGSTNNEFTIPGSQSQQALDSMAKSFPAASGTSAQIVFTAPAGHQVTEPQYASAIDATMAGAAHAPQVRAVLNPLTSKAISPDHRTALGQVQYSAGRTNLDSGSLPALERTAQPAKDAGLTVDVGGSAYGGGAKKGGHAKEAVGVVVALAVLAVTFGSLSAAGMPLLTALAGVAVGLLGLLSLTSVTTISATAPTLAAMLGLAVGIDYALFIVSRHRSQLASGAAVEESAATATGTAGSAVVFAGLTVVIALAGLTVVGIPFLTVMGLGAAATVLIAVAVAVTLLPALLGFAGERLRPKPGSRTMRREQAAAGPADPRRPANAGERWGRLVTRKPLLTVLAVLAALLTIAIPARDLRLALPDNGTAAAGSGPRQAYDQIDRAFGPGFNGPLLILADTTGAADGAQAAAALAKDIRALPDVATVSKPQLNEAAHSALIQVVPKSAPADQQTKDLVKDIRGHADAWQHDTGAKVSVTGSTAVGIDVSDRLAASLLPFALVVIGLSLLLLLLVFRSVVVPLKASLGFLLSVAATFGSVVAVFQWGWLAGLLGVDRTGPVVSFLPIILMAVLFGLAMDYEVFLVSRMREAYVHGAGPRQAVLTGTRHASRVVTAAALIMFTVFAGFIPGADAIFKPIAFSLAVGVLIDAFVVRMTFVPALLTLFGRAAWWLPRRLDRWLPDLDIEGERLRRHDDGSTGSATDNATDSASDGDERHLRAVPEPTRP
ncbi:MMPL family transporter [Kitasatospora sp. MAP5-34]|uniref:MMPL family transporter n=1 Tax=Kitasatospora sp. MAP5-34 TaxID=3035102 RepID=UPI002476ACD2|nr:MMPL family transporter [Kitasatospora sp. MAP5-34]MDH6579926.1 RND superfamily putative drug exporter [Kitasatospora sp. MAP5-34]